MYGVRHIFSHTYTRAPFHNHTPSIEQKQIYTYIYVRQFYLQGTLTIYIIYIRSIIIIINADRH